MALLPAALLLCCWPAVRSLLAAASERAAWPVLDVTACCGAVGDGLHNDTLALRAALRMAEQAGGATVLLPAPGTFLTAPLVIGNNTQLLIPSGSTLKGSADPASYMPVWKRYDGAMALKPASLISAGGCVRRAAASGGGYRRTGCDEWLAAANISIVGDGAIDGGGQAPWRGQHGGRPTLIEPYFLDGFTLRDITLKGSPFWTFHPTFCSNVLAERVSILDAGGNTDGFDPDSCVNVTLLDCYADNGDDCVALNAGKYKGGVDIGLPTRNVFISNLTCHTPISFGSGISGGIENVTITNSRSILSTANKFSLDMPPWFNTAFILKSSRGRGGHIRGVHVTDHRVEGADLLFKANLYYACQNSSDAAFAKCAAQQNRTTAALTPSVSDVKFERITSVSGESNKTLFRIGWLECLPESPCTNITISDVRIEEYQHGWSCSHVQEPHCPTSVSN